MKKTSNISAEDTVIDKYYLEVYNKYLNDKCLVSIANRPLQRIIEKHSNKNDKNVLEIGGGGDSRNHVTVFPQENYVILDPRETSSHVIKKIKKHNSKVKFIIGQAEKILFPDGYFDRVISTCVLAHVNQPLTALLECRRVTKEHGTLTFLLTADPGFLNQLIKKIYSYPKLNKLTEYPANLIYALDHKNGITNLLAIIRYVFRDDNIKVKYWPFFIPSINFNLAIIVKITKLT